MTEQTIEKETPQQDSIFATREVPVLDGRAAATVYPVGIKHLRKFSKTISTAMTVFMAVKRDMPVKDMSDQATGEYLIAEMGPYILENMFDLLEDCVTVEFLEDPTRRIVLDDLPHEDGPALVTEWIQMSFGEEKKWRPWARALDTILKRFGGEQVSISKTLSKLSSKADTA